jgi:pimeloyl-ACP methyl ester carboxylesterase
MRISTSVGRLAVRVRGDGPPAVLWHSLFVDDRSWLRVESDLARDRRLVIITGPGHGASDDPGQRYSLEDCAVGAGEILAALGVTDPVDWVGNAWGGHVGVVFAAASPDRCRTLVTLGTPIQAYSRSARAMFRVMLAGYRVVGMVDFLSSGISDALLSPRTRADDPEALALVLDCLRRMDRHALINAMRSISLGRPDLSPRLSAVRCPTLFITGTHHSEWSPEQAEAKATLLARGSVAVVPDTAYLTPLEAPGETVRLIRDTWGAPSTADPGAAPPVPERAMVGSAPPRP